MAGSPASGPTTPPSFQRMFEGHCSANAIFILAPPYSRAQAPNAAFAQPCANAIAFDTSNGAGRNVGRGIWQTLDPHLPTALLEFVRSGCDVHAARARSSAFGRVGRRRKSLGRRRRSEPRVRVSTAVFDDDAGGEGADRCRSACRSGVRPPNSPHVRHGSRRRSCVREDVVSRRRSRSAVYGEAGCDDCVPARTALRRRGRRVGASLCRRRSWTRVRCNDRRVRAAVCAERTSRIRLHPGGPVRALAFDDRGNLFAQLLDTGVVEFVAPITGTRSAPSAILGCPKGLDCKHGWAGLAFGP